MRPHGHLGSGTFIWHCLAVSNREIHEIDPIMTHHESCPPVGLCTQHFNEHALQTEPCLIPKECYPSPASRYDGWILRISWLKGPLAINMFGPMGAAYSHGRIITLRAAASLRKQVSSASHVLSSLCASTDPWALEWSFGLA